MTSGAFVCVRAFRVCARITYRVAFIAQKYIDVYTHLISTNRELSERNVSRQTRLLRQLLFRPELPPFIRPSVGEKKKVRSKEQAQNRETTSRISTYSMYSICNPFPSLAMSQRIAETRDRLNIARQFEKRHQRPHTGVTRAESK